MNRVSMPLTTISAAALGCLVQIDWAAAEVERWQFGGDAGHPWGEFTDSAANVLMDDFTVPSALQPRELDPEVNFLTQLGPWHGVKFPKSVRYRDGQPRIWRGVNPLGNPSFFPLKYVDGDPGTADVFNEVIRVTQEYYTLDLGGRIPAERFRFYPPDGIDHVSDQPYRPYYNPSGFELSAGNDAEWVAEEGVDLLQKQYAWAVPDIEYEPLEEVLFTTRQHYEPSGVIGIDFPLRFYRFFRLRAFPDSWDDCVVANPAVVRTAECCAGSMGPGWRDFPCFIRLAWAEMEIYGRGFVPEASWESRVVDLGSEFNFGRVLFHASRWRRDGGQLVPAPEAAAWAEVALRTGVDDDPTAWFGFDKRGGHVQVTAEEYETLRVNRPEVDPELVGWRGPVTHDHENWSFWSAPMAESGSRPRVRAGRFFQVRVRLQTDELWAFARLDSLAVEISPLLADRIVAEIAGIGDLRPAGNLTRVRAGEMTEFVYDVRAEFAGEGKAGFDAVRLMTPSHAGFRSLEMGAPLQEVAPDEIIDEGAGFTVYLPRAVGDGEPPLRIRFESALYGASGTFGGEVFKRAGEQLPQAIQAGDASDEIGTNRLQVVAIPSSLTEDLGAVEIEPPVFTPQGDGINERVRIGYSILRIQAGTRVEIGIFALSGERVWSTRSDTQGAGSHVLWWDGRDDRDGLVPPGLYLARVKVTTGEGDSERLQRLAVVY